MRFLTLLLTSAVVAVATFAETRIDFPKVAPIQQSTDLQNWTDIGANDHVIAPDLDYPIFYRQVEDNRPNIVFILTDDMRYDQYSAWGHPFIETPNIDRLATEGINFQRAYVTTPLCGPSRSSIFTGRLPSRHGIRTHTNDNLHAYEMPNGPFLLEEMQKAGYKTGFFGKWFNGRNFNGRVGADMWRGMGHAHKPSSIPWEGIEYWNWFVSVAYNHMFYYWPTGGWTQIHRYSTDVLRDLAVEFIHARNTRNEAPYFLFISFLNPHSPYIPDSQFKGRYSDQGFQIPNYPNLQFNQANSNDYVRQCEMLLSVDEAVRQILDEIGENTIVVFTSDNGFAHGEHGWAGKNHPMEESVGVPLFWYDPGHVIPRSNHDVVGLVDLYQTFLDLAGADTPEDPYRYSKSILPTVYEGKPHRDELIVLHYNASNFNRINFAQIITPDFTYWQFANGSNSLYSYDDPYQLVNLVNEPAFSDVKSDLIERLDNELAHEGANIMGNNPMPIWERDPTTQLVAP
ncbi:MAG: sulfatase-like hydrolase/transferase [Verrucomicrobiota bacterium JB022]|nr:sulfatase-like hydrolase/transferase [Verrucomicrobiota bacterium JB022]